MEGAGADGSDRKLLPELRKVQATSWGCVHEKVTLPWRTTEAQRDLRQAASRWSVWVVASALVSRIRQDDREGGGWRGGRRHLEGDWMMKNLI